MRERRFWTLFTSQSPTPRGVSPCTSLTRHETPVNDLGPGRRPGTGVGSMAEVSVPSAPSQLQVTASLQTLVVRPDLAGSRPGASAMHESSGVTYPAAAIRTPPAPEARPARDPPARRAAGSAETALRRAADQDRSAEGLNSIVICGLLRSSGNGPRGRAMDDWRSPRVRQHLPCDRRAGPGHQGISGCRSRPAARVIGDAILGPSTPGGCRPAPDVG